MQYMMDEEKSLNNSGMDITNILKQKLLEKLMNKLKVRLVQEFSMIELKISEIIN